MSLPYDRIYNFSAGPSCLPVDVLEQAKEEMLNFRGAGMGVMEMSHRGKVFEGILAEAAQDLRTLMNIPADYHVLFLQGGASMQFANVPIYFLTETGSADYIVTGSWGKKAVEAACLAGKVNVLFDAKSTNYDSTPNFVELNHSKDAVYTHFTSNETIQGVDFLKDPEGGRNFVCDMSSNILSRPVDVSRYAMIYAGAQKNMGPAGVTVVILRDDFMRGTKAQNVQPMLDYRVHQENDSMYNTPPTWAIYICGLVYKHLLKMGGLEAQQKLNEAKAGAIYKAIDRGAGFYKPHAQPNCRSLMNVTFVLPDDALTEEFVMGAKQLKMDGLKGHRSVGGCRASIYNAFPQEGCEALAQYMDEFRAKKG